MYTTEDNPCQDSYYMHQAIALAQKGIYTTSPTPNVGCLIVNHGEIVGTGFHLRAGEPHAEVHALRMAGDKAKGATLYVTLEPCCHYGRTPPCADAVIAAGVGRVVIAMEDPNPAVAGGGIDKLQAAGIAVTCGVLQDEAEQLNLGFYKRMRTGLPYLRLKLAATLDGKTAMASGESQWITSPQARQDVQAFRAQSSAILSTAATVLADNALLTVRWQELESAIQVIYPQSALRQPIRVIIDSKARITAQQQILHQPGETWLIRTNASGQVWNDHKEKCEESSSVKELLLPQDAEGIALPMLMRMLGSRGINSIWTEAGAILAGALLQQGLVDELILYLAPKIVGHAARDLCYLPGLDRLEQALQFHLLDICQIGPDIRLRLLPKF